MANVSVYGIRHHGPGSALALLKAFEARRPDLILIECPADAQSALAKASDPRMKLPVALLVYQVENIKKASFFPFAEFSPEWQAIRFGSKNGIETRFVDLPCSLEISEPAAEPVFSSNGFEKDPFAELAELAGFSDHERWWEATFEHSTNQIDVFEAVLDLMRTLRTEKRSPESRETLLREAHMRQGIRNGESEGFMEIAVVCGAWHGPALASFRSVKASEDAALLKNLKKSKTAATWAPWTFERLAMQSGYGAGVLSPMWYQFLWENRSSATVRWLAWAARLFREIDLSASSSQLIDAARLADSLASLRSLPLAGIDELREALLSATGADERWIELIQKKAIVGEQVGETPDDVPLVPLQRDFELQTKKFRLSRYLKNAEDAVLKLDLREPSDLEKSRFLHRLRSLGIEWGQVQEASGRELSTFNESWKFKWEPETALKLIEMSAHGSTIERAAERFCILKTTDEKSLSALVELLDVSMKAHLLKALSAILAEIGAAAALTSDSFLLADALVPLARVFRYGQARKVDQEAVFEIVEHLARRVCLSFSSAVAGVDEATGKSAVQKMAALNGAFGSLGRAELSDTWASALFRIAESNTSSPEPRGFAVRSLFERKKIGPNEAERKMRFELSLLEQAKDGALWLEGFLHGTALLLIHQPELAGLIDGWLCALRQEAFEEILPLLRRAFSGASESERDMLLIIAKNGRKKAEALSTKQNVLKKERADLLQPLFERLFVLTDTAPDGSLSS